MVLKFATVKAKVETVEERNRRAARYSDKCRQRNRAKQEKRVDRLLGVSAAVFFLALAVKLGTMI